jgi:hypothetical protein
MDDYFLVDAKQEYTTYLISILTPSIYNGFKDIYEQSKKIQNTNSVFKNFQILLSNVPQWNNYLLEKEVSHIIKETSCDWLDNLITAVFVSHSKILTSVKVGNYKPKSKKIDLKIPDTINFIHQCYLESARVFYKNPLLFLDDPKKVTTEVYLKNYQIIKNTIKDSILMTIRKMLPFKNILNEYLSLENNTLAIGAASSVHAILPPPQTIELPKVIENPPKITNKLIDNIPLEKNLSLVETLPVTLPIAKQDKNEENSESEKEIVIKGKELILDENDFNETIVTKQKESAPAKRKRTRTPLKSKRISKSLSPKKNNVVNKTESDSINSKTLGDIVSQIRNEIDASKVEQLNVNVRGNIITKNLDNKDDVKSEITFDLNKLKDFKINLDKDSNSNKGSEDALALEGSSTHRVLDELYMGGNPMNKLNELFANEENNQQDNIDDIFGNQSINKLNDIFGNQSINKLNNIFDNQSLNNSIHKDNEPCELEREPLKKQEKSEVSNRFLKEEIKKQEDSRSNPSESNVKKISIKYSVGGSLNNKGKNKKTANSKQKTVLIDSADDTDSSEMPF